MKNKILLNIIIQLLGNFKYKDKELAEYYDEKLTKITIRFCDCLSYFHIKMKKEMY